MLLLALWRGRWRGGKGCAQRHIFQKERYHEHDEADDQRRAKTVDDRGTKGFFRRVKDIRKDRVDLLRHLLRHCRLLRWWRFGCCLLDRSLRDPIYQFSAFTRRAGWQKLGNVAAPTTCDGSCAAALGRRLATSVANELFTTVPKIAMPNVEPSERR